MDLRLDFYFHLSRWPPSLNLDWGESAQNLEPERLYRNPLEVRRDDEAVVAVDRIPLTRAVVAPGRHRPGRRQLLISYS